VEKSKVDCVTYYWVLRILEMSTTKLQGIRRSIHDIIYPYVQQGSRSLVNIQKGHSKGKIHLMEFISLVGSHDFYVIGFPVLYLVFCIPIVARQVLWVLSSGIYLGNWFKDLLCLPRPLPPAQKLSPKYHDEFGFPSTHTVCGFAMPFALIFLTMTPFTIEFYIASTMAILFGVIISYSRMYLGMHTLPDVLGGLGVAIIILLCWFGFGFEIMENWLLEGSYVPIWSIALGVFLLSVQPEPSSHCTCFDDSVCFIGSAVGGMIGTSRYPFFPYENTGLALGILRYILGTGAMLVVRAILKPLTKVLVPKVVGFLGIEGPKRKVDTTSISRFIVYLIMVWVGTEWGPRAMEYFHVY